MTKTWFSDQQIADQLTRDGTHWRGDNGDNVINYSFSSSLGYWWDNDSESALDTTQQIWVGRALTQLEEMFELQFQEVSEPANTETDYPIDTIQFVNDTNTGTYSSSYTYGDGGVVFNAVVFDQTWSSNQSDNLSYGSYGYMTILHEVLHSIGIEHPGSYNAGSGSTPITYANSAEFAQDTHRFTVMSYFSAAEDGSGALHYDTVTSQWVYPSTPMVYDILAMTQGDFAGKFAGYGSNSTASSGDSTYGYNVTTDVDAVYDFATNRAPVVTLYDADGTDTLDLSSDTVTSKVVANYDSSGNIASYSTVVRSDTLIDIREGQYSSTHGMTFNIGIAFGTIIENVIGTRFDDTIHGNDAANIIDGENGADTIFGYQGDDTLSGGIGDDRLVGGDGKDWIDGGAGVDTAVLNADQSSLELVQFGEVVQVFSTDPAENDWTQSIEVFEFTDGQIGINSIQTNDIYAYLAGNTDLLSVFGNNTQSATVHYFENGHGEGRQLDAFDEYAYLASNTDLLAYFGNNASAATQHYVDFGYLEGRATASFEGWSYLASNTDLLPYLGLNIDNANQHFVNYGFGEGRLEDSFDEYLYLASNTDILNVFGNDEAMATYHYLAYGLDEGRSFDFDATQYLANYSDLQAVFAHDVDLALMHYVDYGFYEGRTDDFLGA